MYCLSERNPLYQFTYRPGRPASVILQRRRFGSTLSNARLRSTNTASVCCCGLWWNPPCASDTSFINTSSVDLPSRKPDWSMDNLGLPSPLPLSRIQRILPVIIASAVFATTLMRHTGLYDSSRVLSLPGLGIGIILPANHDRGLIPLHQLAFTSSRSACWLSASSCLSISLCIPSLPGALPTFSPAIACRSSAVVNSPSDGPTPDLILESTPFFNFSSILLSL